ncbi:sensor domain-containing diguanylate cyclase [Gallaecimonas mangrovi]|uniref:sensor domain-containing diguanylate cyclase n=1 Tax=Gallaecimonas mangrovi TaxID=2291597 RepID=UPI000E1FE180|nr:diguanylate cyclase [Gallaecimonas mangrovi]
MIARGFFLLSLLALFYALPSCAGSEFVAAPTVAPAITGIDFLRTPANWTLAQAQQHFAESQGHKAKRPFLNFGINSKPVWVRIAITNPLASPVARRLTTGGIWIEHQDLYQFAQGQWQVFKAGDALLPNRHFLPGVGLVFHLTLPPGPSTLYIRSQASDPITMPISLASSVQATHADLKAHLAFGLLYGMLLVLIGYNVMLYLVFKQQSALFYSLYIGCFLMINTGYNGFGYQWLYPHSPLTQAYMTLLFMVVHGISGALFAISFLSLKRRRPTTYRWLLAYIALGAVGITTLIIMQNQLIADFFAFSYLSAMTVIMLLVGVMNFRHVSGTGYYLLAVSASMTGMLSTSLSVWGLVPFTYIGYHGAAMGVVCEAILLAMILAKNLKVIESDRLRARYLSEYDPLTNLLNRRAFTELGNHLLVSASRKARPLSLLLLDIDYFKSVNDRFGHQVGDQALVHIAKLLTANVRENDLVVRWGGEELALLLPGTTSEQAIQLAESLRRVIEQSPLQAGDNTVRLTASFGIASITDSDKLESLFRIADERLYNAKAKGRNRVEPSAAALLSN